MPEEVNAAEILERVLRKTHEAKLGWQKTANDNTFVCVVEGDYTFSVRKYEYDNDDRIAFWMTDSENEELFRLTGAYGADYAPTPFGASITSSRKLTELYDAARSMALDIKRKLLDAVSVLDRI